MLRQFIMVLISCFYFISPLHANVPSDLNVYLEPNSFTCVDDGRLFGQGLTLISRSGKDGSFSFRMIKIASKTEGSSMQMIDLDFLGMNAYGEKECVQDAANISLITCSRERNFGEPYSSRLLQKNVIEKFLTVSGEYSERELVEFEIVSPLTQDLGRYFRFLPHWCN